VNHAAWRAFIGGGNFDNGDRCGARCLNSNANPWNANGNVGLRCVCDHYKATREGGNGVAVT